MADGPNPEPFEMLKDVKKIKKEYEKSKTEYMFIDDSLYRKLLNICSELYITYYSQLNDEGRFELKRDWHRDYDEYNIYMTAVGKIQRIEKYRDWLYRPKETIRDLTFEEIKKELEIDLIVKKLTAFLERIIYKTDVLNKHIRLNKFLT